MELHICYKSITFGLNHKELLGVYCMKMAEKKQNIVCLRRSFHLSALRIGFFYVGTFY